MKRTVIALSLVLCFVLTSSAFAFPLGAAAAGGNLKERVQGRLQERIRDQIHTQFSALGTCKTDAAELAKTIEQLRFYAENQLQTELKTETENEATKNEAANQIKAELKNMIQQEVRNQIQTAMMNQIKVRRMEKRQFKRQLGKGEYQFKNRGEIKVNGKPVKFDVQPVIKDGRTLVPVRALSEALGAQVAWDPETDSVTITKGETVIMLIIGDDKLYVNGEEIALDVPSSSVNGRTVLPLRAIVEHLGGTVTWDETTNNVDISISDADSTTTNTADTTK